jgi:ketose-bisphosphate aldolase
MLSPLAPLLEDARRGGYAVGTFTVFNMETARGVFEALEAEGVPAGVAVTRRMTPYMDFEGLAGYLRIHAERLSSPVALHLDHATDLALVERALDAGFTSVQYDGVGMELPEKIRTTRTAVALARRYGASIEAELDHIGRIGVDEIGGLTVPDEAASFVSDTGIDILAVSVGTSHGLGQGEANIDLGLIRSISSSTPAFLSLHGGTGARPSQITEAIAAGIAKISYFHGMAEEALSVLREASQSTPHGMLASLLDESLRPAFRDRCRTMIRTFGGPGRPPEASDPTSPAVDARNPG